MGRIRYGIKNVHYALVTAESEGALTYASPVALAGAKSMSLEPQGDHLDEYADNAVWYSGDSNSGYTGTLEFEDTAAADAFLAAVLGWTVGTDGAIVESATDSPVEFALQWQFELAGATEVGKRGQLYRCVASRPSVAGQTKEAGITVATNTVNITAMPRISDDKVKASCISTDSAYSTWFDAVYA